MLPEEFPLGPEEIALLMEAAGYNQTQLATRLGVTSAAISKWINGHCRPSHEHEAALRAVEPRPGRSKQWATYLARVDGIIAANRAPRPPVPETATAQPKLEEVAHKAAVEVVAQQTNLAEVARRAAAEVLAQQPTREEVARQVAAQVVAQQPQPEEVARRVAAEVVAQQPQPEEVARRVAAEMVAQQPQPEEVARRVAAEVVAQQPQAKEVARQVAAEVLAQQPQAKEVARQVAAEVLAQQPQPEEVARKVADEVVAQQDRTARKVDQLRRATWGMTVVSTLGLATVVVACWRNAPPVPSRPPAASIARAVGVADEAASVQRQEHCSDDSRPCMSGLASDATGQMGKKEPAEKWIPPEALEGQKRGPCDEGLREELINGGCWQRVDGPAPCGRLYRLANKCYRPIAADPQRPLSDDSPLRQSQ